jgi:hypothetical protein
MRERKFVVIRPHCKKNTLPKNVPPFRGGGKAIKNLPAVVFQRAIYYNDYKSAPPPVGGGEIYALSQRRGFSSRLKF